MRLLKTVVLLGLLLVALATTNASAQIIELGATGDNVKPSCPAKPCLAVSRTTGYQIRSGGERDNMVAKQDGRLVAWAITLGKPGQKQIKFFDSKLGGESQGKISVMRPVKTGEKYRYVVTGESPLVNLEQYFGKTVQFPLKTTLTVKKGYLIALSVPTWAPALAVGLDNKNSWRASRPKENCEDTQTQTAQDIGGAADYRCFYRTARLTYSATLITNP